MVFVIEYPIPCFTHTVFIFYNSPHEVLVHNLLKFVFKSFISLFNIFVFILDDVFDDMVVWLGVEERQYSVWSIQVYGRSLGHHLEPPLSLLHPLFLEEKPQVVAWEDYALSSVFLGVYVNSSDENGIGTVQEH